MKITIGVFLLLALVFVLRHYEPAPRVQFRASWQDTEGKWHPQPAPSRWARVKLRLEELSDGQTIPANP